MLAILHNNLGGLGGVFELEDSAVDVGSHPDGAVETEEGTSCAEGEDVSERRLAIKSANSIDNERLRTPTS